MVSRRRYPLGAALGSGRCRLPALARCGFTLIELLVVLSILALLLTLAVPRYLQSIETAKEAVLVANLRTAREAIDKYYADRARYPDSLDDLVSAKYLRALPYDPIAETDQAWVIVAPTTGGVEGSVFDLKSGAPGASRDGKPFADF